jgi:hypothetical protein
MPHSWRPDRVSVAAPVARLLDAELYARSPRVDWATLLGRTLVGVPAEGAAADGMR